MTIKDWNDGIRAELSGMSAAGITSYKVYMAYDTLRVTDGTAYEIVQAVGALGGIVGCHCENGDLVTHGMAAMKAAGRMTPEAHPHSRPPVVEAEAVTRWLAISELAGYPVNIVHLSTLRGLAAVHAARARGQKFYVETCPQYLLLDDSKYTLPNFEAAKFVLSPPLRAPEDVSALWTALADGTIDTVGTDHCSFDFKGVKELGRDDFSKIPNGIPGVEHRPALLYSAGVATGRITAHRLMETLSANPAKLFGMYPQKGALLLGSDGDIVIFNPNTTWRITAAAQTQAVDYTPYEGMEVTGKVETVLLHGETVVENGALVAENRGRYVSRGASRFWR